jgi:hypothetical protein
MVTQSAALKIISYNSGGDSNPLLLALFCLLYLDVGKMYHPKDIIAKIVKRWRDFGYKEHQ